MKTVGEIRAALSDYADEDEFVVNIDTLRITVDPAEVLRIEEGTDTIDGKPVRLAHLLVGDWGKS